ncbi:peptidyl-prolyl cis-trans isomerase G [Dioscorea cayenensis subsp. rotundata]|uniref:Peptidyl-prolyl cis-trans isomerase G n=1 Tax=Dioscorea cayennensis subsp. rotundata TaxID=55577 RepID=A0AB40BSI6_DIOCR|nr:peptidyl-prolyl cis-trans isomerase G [Dioscorea cayenensis subsp. rotundata]
MRSTAVSDTKPSKKTSSEDRSRKRKTKSMKRRRDSSLEVSSYSSSEDECRRSRRKNSRRESKRGLRSPSPRRKRRESRKPEKKKKKSRKARHHRNLSISSSENGSSWSCSTCRSRSRSRSVSRSRSPVRADRKERGRGREREKAGKSSRKNRYRSPSCSTCSGGDSNRSSSSRSPIKEIKKEKREFTALEVGFYNDSRDVGRKKDTFEHCPEMKRTDEEVEHVKKDAYSDGSMGMMERRSLLGPVENSNSSKVDDVELVLRLKALENFNKYRVGLLGSCKFGDKKAESGLSECVEDAGKTVETKLPSQAAVERRPAKSMDLQRHEEAESQASEVRIKSAVSRPAEARIKSVVSRPAQLSDALMSTEENNDNVRIKSKAVDNKLIPGNGEALNSHNDNVSIKSKAVDNKLIPSNGEALNSPNQLKSVNELVTLAMDDQAKRTSEEPKSSLVQETEGNKADVSASGASSAPKKETGKHNPSENVAEATQFEQKTFSRMHDGEMVQVSYKVYIPKRAPALARRQLQR